MDKYLILRANITGMGGAQMYVRNKTVNAIKHGFKPVVISSKKGSVLIHDLLCFSNNIIEELTFSPLCYSAKRRKTILNEILQLLEYQPGDRLIVESNDVKMSLWGEFLASKVGGKHFVLLLNEHFSPDERWHLDFFKFKALRREIAGIDNSSMERLFLESYPECVNYEARLAAVCSNVVDDCENSFENLIDCKKRVIGSIGRLDKSYVKKLCAEMKIFFTKHLNEEFQLLFIGGSTNQSDVEFVKNEFLSHPNVQVIISGFVFPISRTVFPKVECFVSAAGSANVSYRMERPTISIDVNTGEAIGIMGFDTLNTVYAREGDHPRSISSALDELSNRIDYINYERSKNDYESEIEKHWEFLSNSSKETQFYNIFKDKRSKNEFIQMLLFSCSNKLGLKMAIAAKERNK